MSVGSLKCSHIPRKYKLEYSCKSTGNYTLELCEHCRSGESNDFLIKEEKI